MNKQGLVYCVNPQDYEIFDERISKPICVKQLNNGIETGSMVFQELDEVLFTNNNLTYFPPNNIALLLSISNKVLKEAKEFYNINIDPKKVNHSYIKTSDDKKEFLKQKSIIVADFIEKIQTSIVFAYTALEAFANISIDDEYQFKINIKNKGIWEIYDKQAIERWVSLKDKLSKILPDIYKTKKIETTKFWSHFVKLEQYRHDIIHQKSIDRTNFYKKYFNADIFKICGCAEEIIKFYYQSHAERNYTNPLWPWLINKEKEFPITTNFKSENFEIVGNLHEGIIKKNK